MKPCTVTLHPATEGNTTKNSTGKSVAKEGFALVSTDNRLLGVISTTELSTYLTNCSQEDLTTLALRSVVIDAQKTARTMTVNSSKDMYTVASGATTVTKATTAINKMTANQKAELLKALQAELSVE